MSRPHNISKPRNAGPLFSFVFRGRGVVFALTLLGLLVYSNTWNSPFILDDWPAIVNNPAIRDPFNLPVLLDAFNTRFFLGWTFAVNYALGGLDVRGYHAVNIAIHLLASIVVYFLARTLFQTPGGSQDPHAGRRDAVSGFVALLFLVHPVQTQAVTYIWQRAASLAALLYLASFWLYWRSRITFSWARYAGSLVLAALSQFTKEISFTLPLALAASELLLGRADGAAAKRRVWMLLPYFLLLPVIPTMFFRVDADRLPLMKPSFTTSKSSPAWSIQKLDDSTRFVGKDIMPRETYYATQPGVVGRYIRLFIFPRGQNLDHDVPLVPGFADAPAVLGLFVLVLAAWVAVRLARSHPLAAFGVGWFFLTISVESLVPQSDVMFEHRMYLPLFGLALSAVCAVFSAWGTRRFTAAVVSLGLAAGACGVLTYQRNKVWRDAVTLWADAAEKSPRKFRPVRSLGNALLDRGDPDGAIAAYDRAIAINPNRPGTYMNRALAYLQKGDAARALEGLNQAIALDPAYASAYLDRAQLLAAQGEREAALADYDAVIGLDPAAAQPYVERGNFFLETGDYERAAADYRTALSANPGLAEAHANLGVIFLRQRKVDEAIAALDQALSLNKEDAVAYRNRGLAYFNRGDYDRSMADIEKARAYGERIPQEFFEQLKENQARSGRS